MIRNFRNLHSNSVFGNIAAELRMALMKLRENFGEKSVESFQKRSGKEAKNK